MDNFKNFKYLIENCNADINFWRDEENEPLISYAFRSNKTEFIDILLKHGADLTIQQNTKAKLTPIHFALRSEKCIENFQSIKKYYSKKLPHNVLNYCANEAYTSKNYELLETIFQFENLDINNIETSKGHNLFIKAIREEDESVIDLFLKYRANI